MKNTFQPPFWKNLGKLPIKTFGRRNGKNLRPPQPQPQVLNLQLRPQNFGLPSNTVINNFLLNKSKFSVGYARLKGCIPKSFHLKSKLSHLSTNSICTKYQAKSYSFKTSINVSAFLRVLDSNVLPFLVSSFRN